MDKFKRTFTWILGLMFLCYVVFILIRFQIGLTDKTWELIQHQWLAVIVFPSACFAALVVVMVLDQVSGDIEIGGPGFSFKGAAAPIVLWGFLVLIMAASLHMLWQPGTGK
jgi:hypothetical protein